jgi:hypothetical protein
VFAEELLAAMAVRAPEGALDGDRCFSH